MKSKGHKYLIEAIRILKFEMQYDIDAYFIGEGKLENDLRNEVNEKDLEKNVRFLGFKSNPYKYVRKANVFVLPALWEGFGNVIVEAMACGVPVISTNCESGPKEIIENEYNGILVAPKNAYDLAENIRKLLDNESFYEMIRDNALLRASDFDIKIIIKIYEEHLLNIKE